MLLLFVIKLTILGIVFSSGLCLYAWYTLHTVAYKQRYIRLPMYVYVCVSLVAYVCVRVRARVRDIRATIFNKHNNFNQFVYLIFHMEIITLYNI